MNAKLYIHPWFTDEPVTLDGQVLIKHAELPQTEMLHARVLRLEDAIVCACDLLRIDANERALEVLESNLR